MSGSKANILGSKPAEDPMDLIESRSRGTVRNTEIRWDDRSIGYPVDKMAGLGLLSFALGVLQPALALAAACTLLAVLFVLPRLRVHLGGLGASSERWAEVSQADIALESEDKVVRSRGTGRDRFITALEAQHIGAILPGNLGKVIRGVDTDFGIQLSVSLSPQDSNGVVEDGVLDASLVSYLEQNSSEQRRAYFYVRGGVWRTGLRLIGSSFDPTHLRLFESQILGSLPVSGLKGVSPQRLSEQLSNWDATSSEQSFMAAGVELSEWLVQIPSELAPEVGSNVPGEFISPIRANLMDYRIGLAINPETLKDGPPVGFSHSNLEAGLLVCGGDWSDRLAAISVLVRELLNLGRRVLIVSQERESIRLASITDGGIGMTLGQDLIVNPVDSEGIRRSKYVSELLLAFEGLAGVNLSAATDFEVALNRVVALGNGTVADVTLNELAEDMETGRVPGSTSSRESRLALDSIRRLHEGSGAQAFYGTQTASMKRIAEQDLAVIVIPFESPDLTMFAYDILCLKLSGLEPDPDLVVILDSPTNLLVSGSTFRYTKKSIMAISQVRDLLRRGPLVASIKSPAGLPNECADSFGSCLALRLRETPDIAAVSDLLSLSVVGVGIHSKKRVSSRESSFLRVMEPNQALLSHPEMKTCVPVRLDSPPPLEHLSSSVVHGINREERSSSDRKKTLLETIGGKDSQSLVQVLGLLTKYEPLTEQSVAQFLKASGSPDVDVEATLARLEKASMILRGQETHGGVSYTNYRITMKGTMALRQAEGVSA